LLVSFRKLRARAVRVLAEAEPLDPRGGLPLVVGRREAVEPPEVRDLVLDLELAVEAALLRQVPEASSHSSVDGCAVPGHRPTIGDEDAEDHAHRRRLPGTVRPEETEGRPRRDR